MPPVWVNANELKRVLENLLSNALRAVVQRTELQRANSQPSYPGLITVDLGLDEVSNQVWFTVADNGIGIPERKLKLIFEHGFTTKNRATEKGGEGLWLVNWFLHKAGGNISVASTVGQGTEFMIRLPVYQAPAEEEAAVSQPESAQGEDKAQMAALSRQPSVVSPEYGGIDLTAANQNLQIKRDKKGVPLPLPLQNIQNIHIDGLQPLIIDVQPAKLQTFPFLLSAAKEEKGQRPF